MKRNQDLTSGSILKGFFLFALPLFLGSLFQQLYGTVDLLFVGNLLGKRDAAAVGAGSILVVCLIGLFTGISVGAGVVAAQYWGAKDERSVRECIKNSLLLGTAGGIVLTAAGLLLSRQALIWLNTPEEIMEPAVVYIRIYLLSIVPMILYNMSAGILRAMGDSRTPFLVLAAGGILNVCMDALFLAVFRMGVEGAALATMVSQGFTAIVLTCHIIKRERLLGEKWKFSGKMCGRILKVGFPLGIQSMILTLSNLFVQYYINGFGEDAVAAFTVYFRAETLIYLPIMAFGQAMVTFTGQNIGAKKESRIREGAIRCNISAAAVIAAISAVILMFGKQVLGLFCQDPAVIREGLKIIHISFPFYFIYSVLEVTGGILRGAGKSLQSMMIIVINLCVIRVLLLGILVRSFHTIEAVAAVYPVTWALAACCFVGYVLYYFHSGEFYAKSGL